MSHPKHTSIPWEWNEEFRSLVDPANTVISVDGIAQPHGYVADDDVSRENAKFIALACNSHYDLMDALQLFMGIWGSGDSTKSSKRAQQRRADMWTKANAAIAKAKGTAE